MKSGRIRWILLLIVALLAGGAISVYRGQDINWDLRNYHLYNAWAFLNHRLFTDIYVAGIQTYFAPILDIPYYFLATRWLPHEPAMVAFIMGLPFGILICLTVLITWLATSDYHLDRWTRVLVCAAMSLFGLSGVVIVAQIGRTFNEIQISAIAGCGLLLLLLAGRTANSAARETTRRLFFAAGLVFGAAAALKLTAAVYTPGAAILCLIQPGSIRQRATRFCLFSVGWWLSVLVLWGPWGYDLYRLTGNPIFPMFNNVFRSSWTAAQGGRDMHAMPNGLLQSLFYPFYWLRPANKVMELGFADPRFAVVFVILVCCGLLRAVAAFQGSARTPPPTSTASGRSVTTNLIVFFVLSYVVWEGVFSILRYAGTLECISGPVVLAACLPIYRRLRPSIPRKTVTLAAIAAAPLLAIAASTYPDYGWVPYGESVFSVTRPSIAPGATIVFADPPMAFIIPMIAQQSPGVSFIGMPNYLNAKGGYTLERQVWQRLNAAKRLYVAYNQADFPPAARVAAFGLSIDYDACQTIETNITSDLSLCPAYRDSTATPARILRFRIVSVPDPALKNATFTVDFANGCSDNGDQTAATIRYSAAPPVGGIKIYLQTKPLPPNMFWSGPPSGVVSTGAWVSGGQDIIVSDASGRVLAKSKLQYQRCQ